MRLANTYPSLVLTLIECIQNAIDGEAQHIFVGIDLKRRRVNVADDGVGVDVFTFERALSSVGQSIKSANKLGRFGMGLISPLNKCANFTFMSSPISENRRRSTRWQFEAKAIRAQHTEISIPREQVAALPVLSQQFAPHATGEFKQIWRTMVAMNAVTEDKVISLMDLDELESETLSKLGNVMRQRSVVVRVVLIDGQERVQTRDITASSFSGEAFPLVRYDLEKAGGVELQLYRAPKRSGRRQGLVSVMETGNPSSISIRDFARQARMSSWSAEVEPAVAALNSGHFEGTIRADGITMHPERTKFELNDALREVYYALAQWFEDHGKLQFENEQEVSRESRYQDLGLKSQARLQEFLSHPENKRLLTVLQSAVAIGRMGDGHVTPGSGRPTGQDEAATTRVGQGGAGVARVPSGKPHSPRSTEPGPDRPGDTPLGVMGPNGKRRRLVRGDSQGLWYEYSQLPANSHLWEFDMQQGVLTFNVRHPVWARLDETRGKHLARNAKWIMHLQEWLTLQVLLLISSYPESNDFEEHRSSVDDQIRPYVDMFIVANR